MKSSLISCCCLRFYSGFQDVSSFWLKSFMSLQDVYGVIVLHCFHPFGQTKKHTYSNLFREHPFRLLYVLLFSGSQFWSNPGTETNNSAVHVLSFPKIYPKIKSNFRAVLNIKWCFFWDLHQLEFWANFDSSCVCSYIPKGFRKKQNCWVLYIERNLVWTDCPWTFFDPWRDEESVIQRWKTPVKLTFWTGDFYLFEKGSHLSHPPSGLWVPKMFIFRAVSMHVPCTRAGVAK